MIDAGHDSTVARAQVVRAVVEDEIHAAVEDNVEIDGVGVMHRNGRTRLEVEYQRSSRPGNKPLLKVVP